MPSLQHRCMGLAFGRSIPRLGAGYQHEGKPGEAQAERLECQTCERSSGAEAVDGEITGASFLGAKAGPLAFHLASQLLQQLAVDPLILKAPGFSTTD